MRYNGDESKKDIHEGNIPYMENCRRCALYAAKKRGWSVISACAEDGREYTPDEITGMLLSEINELI